jgi:hypothetical protein
LAFGALSSRPVPAKAAYIDGALFSNENAVMSGVGCDDKKHGKKHPSNARWRRRRAVAFGAMGFL